MVSDATNSMECQPRDESTEAIFVLFVLNQTGSVTAIRIIISPPLKTDPNYTDLL